MAADHAATVTWGWSWVGGQLSCSLGLWLPLRVTANTPSSPLFTFYFPIWPPRREVAVHTAAWLALVRDRNRQAPGQETQVQLEASLRMGARHSFISSFILSFTHLQPANILNNLLKNARWVGKVRQRRAGHRVCLQVHCVSADL